MNLRPPPHAEPVPAEAGAVLTVDLAAVRANHRLLRGLCGPAECAAVVKADAYGLGAAALVTSLAAQGCETFFTAHWAEARALPRAARTVFVLNGVMPGAEDAAAGEGTGRIVPVLNSLPQAEAWSEAARRRGETLPAALHVDTGLSRLGLSHGEVAALLERPQILGRLDLRLLLSHLACADEPDHPANGRQLAVFRRLRDRFPGVRASLANSAAVFLGPDYRFDLVRVGAALYGVNPLLPPAVNPMRQAVRLQARLVQLRMLERGDAVGYGGDFVAPRALLVGTAALGYGDGWPRRARTAAFFRGCRLAVLGRISMDTTVLDLSAVPESLALRPGALVDFLCEEQSPDDVAAVAGTIGYEVLTGLGSRPIRRYLANDWE
jgi:alanine racemase